MRVGSENGLYIMGSILSCFAGVFVMLRHMIMGSDLTVSLVHFVFSLIAVLCHIEGE